MRGDSGYVKVRRVFAIALAVLFSGYMLWTARYLHTHIVDAHSVTHAHPYQDAGHAHSFFDLTTFLYSQIIETTAPSAAFRFDVDLHVLYEAVIPASCLCLLGVGQNISSRAPPVAVFC